MADVFDIVSYLMGKQAGGGGGGGGGFGYTKLAEQDFTVNTSSTTQQNVGTLQCGAQAWTDSKMLYVRVRDKAGPRDGYFYGTDTLCLNDFRAGESNVTTGYPIVLIGTSDGTRRFVVSSSYGIYSPNVNANGAVQISAKYSAAYTKTINGTYHIEVYLLDWPDGVSPFAT